eukprot:Skav208031  [mRNA]  locus=scaffold2714:532868:533833:+ [translate_table: standard]
MKYNPDFENQSIPTTSFEQGEGGGSGGYGGSDLPDRGGDEPDDFDDSSDPDDDDYDPFDEQYDTGYINVGIKLTFAFKNFKAGDIFRFLLNPRWKAKSLSMLVSNKFKIRASHQEFHLPSGDLVLQSITLEQNGIRDGSTLTLVILGKGGASKRPRADYVQEQLNIKDVKQLTSEGLLRLGSERGDVIGELISKSKNIIDLANSKPKEVMTILLKTLPPETLSKMATGTMPHSTRIGERIAFITENSLEGDWNKLTELKTQTAVVEKLLCNSVRYAVMCQFSDPSGNSILWQPLTKTMSDMMLPANRPREGEERASGCFVM